MHIAAGGLMFNRNKRKTSRKKETSIDTQKIRRALSICASVAVFGGAAMILLVQTPRMQDRLAARIAESPPQVVIDWPRSPGAATTWLPGEVQHDLLATATQQVRKHPDPFSPALLEQISSSLRQTGWFEDIQQVRRERGNIIRIEGTWRTPAAVVRHNDVDYLISRRGELLPVAYQPNRAPLPAIVGARFDPPTTDRGQLAYGRIWPGADVSAGLEVLNLINTRPWRDQVAAIDVGQYLPARRLDLVTQWDGRAVWGGAPSDSIPGEVTADRKLLRLDVLHQQFQRIDARSRHVEVAGPMTLVDDSPGEGAS